MPQGNVGLILACVVPWWAGSFLPAPRDAVKLENNIMKWSLQFKVVRLLYMIIKRVFAWLTQVDMLLISCLFFCFVSPFFILVLCFQLKIWLMIWLSFVTFSQFCKDMFDLDMGIVPGVPHIKNCYGKGRVLSPFFCSMNNIIFFFFNSLCYSHMCIMWVHTLWKWLWYMTSARTIFCKIFNRQYNFFFLCYSRFDSHKYLIKK